MVRKPGGILLGVAAAALFVAVARADTVYVQADSADVRADKTADAGLVDTVKAGDALDVQATDGDWLQVTTPSGKTGWIYSGNTAPTKPDTGESALSGLGGGASAQEASAGSSIRGLSPTSERYAGRAHIGPQDVAAVKKMESIRISKVEITSFLKSRKIGEYAR